MTKNYTVRNRRTGKTPSRKFRTRDEARSFKRETGFKYDIVRLADGTVVR